MTLRNIACRIRKSAMGIVVVAAASLISSTGALAGDAKEAAAAGDASKPATAAESAGKTAPRMIVTIDRDSGRLRPATAAERAALAASGRRVLGRTGEATVVETRADGSKHARLGPEFSHWSVARAKADGTVSDDCVPAGKVGAAVDATAPAAPAAPEK